MPCLKTFLNAQVCLYLKLNFGVKTTIFGNRLWWTLKDEWFIEIMHKSWPISHSLIDWMKYLVRSADWLTEIFSWMIISIDWLVYRQKGICIDNFTNLWINALSVWCPVTKKHWSWKRFKYPKNIFNQIQVERGPDSRLNTYIGRSRKKEAKQKIPGHFQINFHKIIQTARS